MVFNLSQVFPDPQIRPAWRSGPWPARLAEGLFVLAVLVLRWPLWRLPGPGRDEAAYHYWAHHFEPAYAPLLQAAVRLMEVFAGHSLWSLRAPVMALGLLVILLNDRRLALVRTPVSLRRLAAVALAFSPWQSFSSSILHPDNFLLVALLGMVLAVQHNRLWWAAVAAVAAVLAKPTGVLFLPVSWWLFGQLEGVPARQLWAARVVLAATALGLALVMDPRMIAGMADFGRLSPHLPWYDRALAVGGSLMYLGGPLLVGLAWTGARQRWRDVRSHEDLGHQREARASLAIAGMILAVFLAAILLRGQFKGNWVLPAAVLLWPTAWPRWGKTPVFKIIVAAGLALTFLGSLGQTAIHVRPDLVGRLENHLATRDLTPRWATYATQAGVRETAVSTSRTWSDHLREYDDLTGFAAEIKTSWCDAQGATAPLDWIVTGDYGLACQLHWYLGDNAARVAICDDEIFNRTWAALRRLDPDGPLLALSSTVAGSLSGKLSGNLPGGELEFQTFLPLMPHPVTGRSLRPAVVRWKADSNQENSHEDLR
jgi:hypothetical protein